jgi:DNA-binding transcriptional ArsR family regulator
MTASQLDSFQAIADANRRSILMMLSTNECTINTIAGQFDISRPAISKHIKVLEQAGLISIEDKGRERYCVLNQAGFTEIQNWLNYFENHWKKELANLETFLDKKHGKKLK